MPSFTAIPTQYKGLQFRSRLEATWAAFFDLVDWPWEYEPFDLKGYIPDFVLKFPKPMLVEVKPAMSLAEMEPHRAKIEASGWEGEYLILGAGPLAVHRNYNSDIIGGMLENPEMGYGGGFDGAAFGECFRGAARDHYGLSHVTGEYTCRVCGIHDKYPVGPLPDDGFQSLWHAAKNVAQWRPN